MDEGSALAAAEEWWAELRARGRSAATLRHYERTLRSVLQQVANDASVDLEALSLADLTPARLSGAIESYRYRPDARYRDAAAAPAERSARSVHERVSVVRAFGSWCVEAERVARSPAQRLRAQLPRVAGVQPLTLEEGRDVLRAASLGQRSERDQLLVTAALTMGLGVGELAELQLADITSAGWWVGRGARRRVVGVTPAATRALEAYLPERRRVLARLGVETEQTLLVSRRVREEGGVRRASATPEALSRALKRVLRDAGLAEKRANQVLRASFARMVVDAGVSVTEVQAALGLSSLAGVRALLGEGAASAAARSHPLASG